MLSFTLRRLLYMVITLWLIVTLTFFLMKSLPGDPFGEEVMKLTAEQRAILYAQYGLDKPVWQQYLKFLNETVHGNLGVSYSFPTQEVTSIIKQSFPASLELGLWALLISVVIGLFLGIIASLNHNKGPDYIAMLLSVAGISIPSFVLAPLLSYVVGVKLGWLPPGMWNGPSYRILPSIALSFGTMAIVARMMRTSMLDVLNQDYIKTARAKGLSRGSIVFKHTVRNAILPVVTVLGPIFVNLITGTLIVEQIFVVPGLGKHFVQSIYSNDYTMITGLTIFYSFILMLVLFLTDVVYGLVDPRIRLGKGGA
ncbi:ABC transporter permease [Paenibacillus thalictri]|uniref:ABC transporter permease n=1 Tax=Paenibacillus thalictri TaxID=2527873 RepID=A0A4V2J464_9BACL|nr:ABC transporter permease [Paenibacillus thalictri]TBL78138.1 ABC transporter permease [Paenibacillus thalictri]